MSDVDDLIHLDGPEDEPEQGHTLDGPDLAEQVDPVVKPAPSIADSPMERLRAAATARFEQDTKAFLLPGTQGIMAMELRVLDKKDTRALRGAAERSRSMSQKGTAQQQEQNQMLDLLVKAEVGLCLVEDGQAVPALDNGERLGWAYITETIPEHLRNNDRSPKRGATDAFRGGKLGKFNEIAFGTFVDTFAKWLADTTTNLDSIVDVVVDTQGDLISEQFSSGS